MQAATVEVLVQKGKFDPQIAVAVAEAIDMAINGSQLVTVPILDARLAALESRFETRFAAIDARFATFEANVDARFTASEARMDAKLESLRSDLVRWVLLVMLGNVALSTGAAAILNYLQR